MAESTIKKEITVTLKLNGEEARYLKGLLQSSLVLSSEEESAWCKKNRVAIWEAIPSIERLQ